MSKEKFQKLLNRIDRLSKDSTSLVRSIMRGKESLDFNKNVCVSASGALFSIKTIDNKGNLTSYDKTVISINTLNFNDKLTVIKQLIEQIC